ncbi:MAG: acyl CoA:acetate/3-ketoacid CoA transferase [Fusobacteriaceae bacterium]
MRKVEFLSAEKVTAKIKSGVTIATGGFVGIGVPEGILKEIEKRFLEKGAPRGVNLIYAAGQGDGKEKGLNRFGYEGMVDTVIGGHWGLAPKLGKLAFENKIKGYNLPQGVISQLFRDIAAGKPGTISKVGMGTFVDPSIEGGKVNKITTKDIVSKITLCGEEYLFYKGVKIDVALLRGTSADEFGNITMEKEALKLEVEAIAMATKNSGGIVIVQVERKIKSGSVDPKLVQIPGILVDYIVVVDDISDHMQTFDIQYREDFVENNIIKSFINDSLPLDERKIIARRCAMMLKMEDTILNYGIGMPEGIAEILKEEGEAHHFVPTVEPGAIGGTPAGGLSFGASIAPEAIISQPSQFDFYDGGGIDIAFLGLAQCDIAGNINVSKFGPKLAGCGGFINITQNAKNVIFCGTFTAGGLKIISKDGKLNVLKEGKVKKFISQVEQITFSGNLARSNGKIITYVTERAVFELRKEGLTLIEIAPGIDLEKDILNQMDFKPLIANDLKEMDSKIFQDELMGLKFF